MASTTKPAVKKRKPKAAVTTKPAVVKRKPKVKRPTYQIPDDPEALLTSNEVCRALNVTPRWLGRQVFERKIPTVKMRHLNRFRARDIRRIQKQGLPE